MGAKIEWAWGPGPVWRIQSLDGANCTGCGNVTRLEQPRATADRGVDKLADDSREISCRRNMLSFFGIERVVDRALGCGHRRVPAARCALLCPGPGPGLGLDRP